MIIATEHLTKVYAETVACEDICLSVEEGQVFGLLGPNGAGKSTLVKMLLSLARPTSGQAFICGLPAHEVRARKRVGYLPEMFQYYEWLSAKELLECFARMHGIPPRLRRGALAEALYTVGLKGRENERIKNYSKGMQQRLGLAAAIVHKPKLVFLDEPTSALDPVGRRDVRDIIYRLREGGTTVFLNSHLLSEVELTCTHLGFINKGHLVACGPMSKFLKAGHEVEMEAEGIGPELLERLRSDERLLEMEGGRLVLAIRDKEEIPRLVALLVEGGASIYRVQLKSAGLEEVFLDMIRGQGA